jgi:hypothetical protein
LYLERRGLLHYWHSKTGGGAGYNPFQEFIQPQARHVVEVQEQRAITRTKEFRLSLSARTSKTLVLHAVTSASEIAYRSLAASPAASAIGAAAIGSKMAEVRDAMGAQELG